MAISRFFRRYDLKVMSHDFRKSMITDMYNNSKDIYACQLYVGHRSSVTTEGYIQKSYENVDKALRAVRAQQEGQKKPRKN